MSMRRLVSSARALGLMLLGCSATSADAIDFSIGFTGVHTTDASAGSIQYTDVHVASDESPANAKRYRVSSSLLVKDAAGASVCEVGSVLITTVRPAITPLRFQVSHPRPLHPLEPTPRSATKKYSLWGEILVIDMEAHQMLENAKHQWEADFRSGGTPLCKIILTEGQ